MCGFLGRDGIQILVLCGFECADTVIHRDGDQPFHALIGSDLGSRDAVIWEQRTGSHEAPEAPCALEEVSSGKHSRFVPRMEASSLRKNWIQLGILRSCCGPKRCQVTGGDVFLAYFDAQTTPRALAQASIYDWGNGSYALLLPKETLLPGGSYTLSIYLHEALNRSAFGRTHRWPVADPQGEEDLLDAFDLPEAGVPAFVQPGHDLRAVYEHSSMGSPLKVGMQWRKNEDLEEWKTALSKLPRCGPQSTDSRREGGFWLRLDGKLVTCAGVGLRGCGAFSLLMPDSAFRHVYLERNCYYPLRTNRYIQKCLAKKKVLLHGDSTTHGLLQEALGMWSEVKPHKDPLNKSDVCHFNISSVGDDGKEIPPNTWTSEYCNFRGEAKLHDVILNGRSVIASPKQYFRKPRCHGLKNLEDEAVLVRFVAMLQDFDVLVMHSCDHDLCNEGFAKPRLLDEYRRHLKRFAKVMRKYAANKRIIWLSCAAQSGLASVAHFSQMQVLKWRMDRLALQMCQQNGWEFLDGFSLYSAALLRVRWFDHLGRGGDLHTHSHCCPRGSLAELEKLRRDQDQLPYRLAYQGGVGYLSRMLLQMLFNQICLAPEKPARREPVQVNKVTKSDATTSQLPILPCELWEPSKAEASHFQMQDPPFRDSEVKVGWLQLGLLRSCCGAFRCQDTGGDVFLAYLDGQKAPKALAQPNIHDFGNGSYALLLPKETLLPSGTYNLQIYLHQALNRSAYRSFVGSSAPWPIADILGTQDLLDSLDARLADSDSHRVDWQSIYLHLPSNVAVSTPLLHWQWRQGASEEQWHHALAALPICQAQLTSSRRQGGLWLQLGKEDGDLPCAGLGQQGCGAFDLLSPDSAFHHMYVERDCYYLLRDKRSIQKCLGTKEVKVLLHGDSTIHGLLQEALGMWSDIKPFKNPMNKSGFCTYNLSFIPRKHRYAMRWSSPLCNQRGESQLHDVVLAGRRVISNPAQFFRTPQCRGLANLAHPWSASHFAELLKAYDVIMLHSCSHDLCNQNYAKPRLLEGYGKNLQRLAKILRRHARNKRIIWLSCAAQSGLKYTWKFTQTQLLKWRMDRLAFEMCQENGWEFIDGFSMYSAALIRDRWFDHRGFSGDVHTHSHCCPKGSQSEIAELRKQKDQLPYRLAFQGGAGYLSRVLIQIVLNQICSTRSTTNRRDSKHQMRRSRHHAELPSGVPPVAVPPSTTGAPPDTTRASSSAVDVSKCELWEPSKAEASHFQMQNPPFRASEVKVGWLQLGLLRSCCGEFRCQDTGGDVFLAYLNGQKAPKALAQPTIHDFGNGSYALLLPEETLLPSGTYNLQIYLHEALNRSAYFEYFVSSQNPSAIDPVISESTKSMESWKDSVFDPPVADVFGQKSFMDSMDSVPDLRLLYLHLGRAKLPDQALGETGATVQWRWPGGTWKDWREALSQLPPCRRRDTNTLQLSRRLGGFWLRVGGKHVPCRGVGKEGCGAFDLLLPDASFHHVYIERNCYYPIRDGHYIQKCLRDKKVLLLGDSTTQGLLQEALGMWSEVKPYNDPFNKSDICSYQESYRVEQKRIVGTWSSSLCDIQGEAQQRAVILKGRPSIAMRTQSLRRPKCRGLGNLAERSAVHDLTEELQHFDVLLLHSCDHDLCMEVAQGKPRLLQEYKKNLQHLAKILRKRAVGKRIIWLSCAAQGNLTTTRRFTQTQMFKWHMDRLALETCKENGWEFIDGFSLYSAALIKSRWFEHRGIAGDLHTHSHCCPRGNASELAALAREVDLLPFRLAYQGGVGYLPRMLMQMIFNHICE